MIRNCKIGQRVKILPLSSRATSLRDGKTVMLYDATRCNTGTVTRREVFSQGVMLVVALDAPNMGELWLRPKDVEKLRPS